MDFPNNPNVNQFHNGWRYDGHNWQAPPGGGGGGGGDNANPQMYDDLLNKLPKAQDYAASLDARDNEAFTDYLKVAQGQQKPLDFYTGALNEAGVPQMRKTASTLQGQIYNMEDTLRRVEGDVIANSRNSIVTDSQRRGMTTERQKPLVENLAWLGQSVGRISDSISKETSNAMNLTGLNQQGQQMELDPYKMRIQMVAEQNARRMTGFTTDLQNTLEVGLAKIKRGEQLDDREFARVAELAKMEKEYQLKAQQTKDYLTIGEGTTVFDPNTGKAVYTAPKTYKPSNDGSSNTSKYYSTPTNYYSSAAPQYSAKNGTIVGNYYSTGSSWIPIVP